MLYKLGDIVNIKTGKLDANAANKNGKYPFFTCSATPLKINSYSYDCECVLVAGNGDLNVKYYNGKFDAYQRTYIIESNCNMLFMPYLYYFLCSYVATLRIQSIGGIIKYIKLNNLTSAKINLPSLQEQKRIVGILRLVDNIKNDYRMYMEKLDLLIKARFVEMFGDPSVNNKSFKIDHLSSIAEYWNGLTYKPKDVTDNGIIVLRSSNVQNNAIDLNDIVRVNCSVPENKFVKENDILMCSRNGSAKLVGKTAIIKPLNEKMCFGAFMMIVRSNYAHYLNTYFQLPIFREQIKSGATTTINQITRKMLDNIKLPIPPLELQNQFADIVTQVEKVKACVQKSLDETQMLFDSLMQQYFG